MKYRDAKRLQPGDQVKSKELGIFLIVQDVELLWISNTVRINCLTSNKQKITVYNNDIE